MFGRAFYQCLLVEHTFDWFPVLVACTNAQWMKARQRAKADGSFSSCAYDTEGHHLLSDTLGQLLTYPSCVFLLSAIMLVLIHSISISKPNRVHRRNLSAILSQGTLIDKTRGPLLAVGKQLFQQPCEWIAL